MADLWSSENLIAFVTLTSLEIVLGIDNLVFLSILSAKLPHEKRAAARMVGLALALGGRIALLLGITWVMSLTRDWFHLFGRGFSGKDLILFGGGIFLVGKSTHEIHERLNPPIDQDPATVRHASFVSVVSQIVVLDLVFSLDSVITAVGMAQRIEVMIAAVVLAVIIMMVFSGAISRFIEKHPAMKVLALAFLILIGVLLVAEAMDQHIDRKMIYFAMAFALGVEVLHIRIQQADRRRAMQPATQGKANGTV